MLDFDLLKKKKGEKIFYALLQQKITENSRCWVCKLQKGDIDRIMMLIDAFSFCGKLVMTPKEVVLLSYKMHCIVKWPEDSCRHFLMQKTSLD